MPLPRGKFLHLGPMKSGQIATEAVEHASLKKLIDAGEVELVEDGGSGGGGGHGGGGGGGERTGHGGGGGVMRRSGDR